MIIISHRGYWKSIDEKNKELAFRRSFKLGFGTEVDVRDLAGKLIISHDPPVGDELSFEHFLNIYSEHDPSLPLAINIKADGLQTSLKYLLYKYSIKNYFVFDMSVPDTLAYIKHNLNIFTRISEYEKVPYFYDAAMGIWADCFYTDWIDEKIIATNLKAGKKICLVSPELHKRKQDYFWDRLTKMSILTSQNLMICTDYPEQARAVFNA